MYGEEIFVLVIHNVAANLLFEKSSELENQEELHSLSLSDVRKQRAAEVRLFFLGKCLCLLSFGVLTDPCCCAAPGKFCVLCTGAEVAFGDVV